MKVRRLGWAGIELQAEGASAVVDLFQDTKPLALFMGEPRERFYEPKPASVSLALVTHLHSDHADPHAVARALAADGLLLRPPRAKGQGMETAGTARAEAGFEELGVDARVVSPWETVEAGPFRATALPAVDGFGDPQISWLLAAEGHQIIHCGDTLFHGWWWLARMRHGPVDAAFLPINAPTLQLPNRQPYSELQTVMDPTQAAEAAALLEATLAVPIHYDAFHNPPIYDQSGEPGPAFDRAAAARGVRAMRLAPGEYLDLAAPARAAAPFAGL